MAGPPAPTEDLIFAPDTGSTVLVASDGRISSHSLAGSGKASFLIGRSPECDIVISEPWVSRRHAQLELGPPHRLTDLGSANGTRHRGQKLAKDEPVELGLGEIFEVGRTLVLLPRPAEAAAAPPPRSAMDAARALVERVAPTELVLLFSGETGAGKEVLAERAHALSRHAQGRFVVVNAATLGDAGLPRDALELASGGTLLLDEVAELAPRVQAKILHVLEARGDVRFMAASNRSLRVEIAEGRFRSDLFYRLNGVSIHVPPLRERLAELDTLIAEIVPGVSLSEDARAVLERHDWPGNVRELRHTLERARAIAGGDTIRAGDLRLEVAETTRSYPRLTLHDEVGELEEARIRKVLEACGGNQSAAAKILGVSRNTLIARIRAYGLPRPQRRGN